MDEQKQSRERGALIKEMARRLQGVTETPKGKRAGEMDDWDAEKDKLCSVAV